MNKEKKVFLEELGKLWEEYPSERFGQLLFNHTRFGTKTEYLGLIRDIFHYQDKGVLEDIKTSRR